ncbi:MAG: type VI secretion system lipoprotein TssJ [Thermodesulfobacteriota bacterium]|nr:type VI secretion system lipoprotein TssJ [Thermodesulfobacteriota bacterium]
MQRSWISGLTIVMLMACLAGCFSKKPLPEPAWQPQSAAIKLHCRADQRLNEFDGRPHTLLLVVYQLKAPDFFTKLAKDEDGLKRLLRFETVKERLAGNQNDVAACQRFILNPGQEKTIVLDRIEGVKVIGVVAGYYNLVPDRVSRFWELPVQYNREGLLFWKVEAMVDELTVDLTMGPHALTAAPPNHSEKEAE